MESVDRRKFLALAAAVPPLMQAQTAKPGGMFVCMHEASADKFDFKTAMEGWAKGGIKAVEPNLTYLSASAWGSSRVLMIGRFSVVSRPDLDLEEVRHAG